MRLLVTHLRHSALKVVDAAPEMVITVDAGEDDAANVGVRVKMPDGRLRPRQRAVVDYTNYYFGTAVEYNGTATLAVPGGASPVPTVVPTPTPPGEPTPGPAP